MNTNEARPLGQDTDEGEVCELPIQGMTCASCVRRVERALESVPGVVEARVNYATQRATVRFADGGMALGRLVRAVEDAGYSVPGGVPSDEPEADEPEAEVLTLGGGDVRHVGGALRGALPPPQEKAAPKPRTSAHRARPSAADTARVMEEAEAAEDRAIRRSLAFSLALTVPLLVIAMSHGAIPGTGGTFGTWLQFAMATPVVFGPGRRFLRLAWGAARHGVADMNTLVSVGVLAAWTYSFVATVAPGLFPHAEHGVVPHVYYEAAAAIVSFVLLGKWMETRARRRLSDAVRGLVALVPPTARRLRSDGEEDEVSVEALAPGDHLRVRPGERVPTDGEVAEGTSAIDESMLTGESIPVDKRPGDAIYGGTLNQAGALVVRVTRTGEQTALARIVEAVEQAQGSRAPIARLADRVSAVFVPIVFAVAAFTFLVWTLLDPSATGIATAVERFVAVLVIACPCALGLATPAAVAVGTGRGAELGILVKGGAALEAASRVNTVLLDKTGTLTTGRPVLTDVVTRGITEREVLTLVASLEALSEHPVARSIVEGAKERGAEVRPAAGFVVQAGAGVSGRVGLRVVRVGTRAWLGAAGIDADGLEPVAMDLAEHGRTPVFVAVDGVAVAVIAVADRPADGAREAVQALRSQGIEVAMLTGDRLGTARAIAAELGIDRVIAEVRPEDKARVVAEERARGRIVAMVGDGINDAPALAGAHVGVAIGTGTDIAVAAADVALVKGGISSLPRALHLARATLGTIRQNLFWAFVYNIVGIPVAAGALYVWTGWLLSPVLASAAMSLSSVSVLANSLRLRRFGRA